MGLSVPSQRVVRVLNELVAVYGCPQGFSLDLWSLSNATVL